MPGGSNTVVPSVLQLPDNALDSVKSAILKGEKYEEITEHSNSPE